jgi:uncharacterized repeat protein (TIGR03803 family)
MGKFGFAKMACLAAIFCVAGVLAAPAQTFQTLVNFNYSNGAFPSALTQGTDGNLYGTSGYPVGGTVFKVTPDGTLTTLYTFCTTASCLDGHLPSGLVEGPDGNFYGTTQEGGANNQGTVFQVTPTGTLTTLYSFCTLANCSDGSGPIAGLVFGSDGNLYGTTPAGGANDAQPCGSTGCGTAFKITTTGALTTLYSFCSQTNCADGLEPSAALVQGSDGNFYGTTLIGGTGPTGGGTVFRLTPTGTLTTLYAFCSLAKCADGFSPSGTLVQGTDGDFYGTTSGGGTGDTGSNTGGTFFSITTSGVLTTLYNFCSLANCADGQIPFGMVQGVDGNFYGVTNQGGTPVHPLDSTKIDCQVQDGGCGTLYRLTPAGTLTTLWNFCTEKACDDGAFPLAAPIQASNGTFYSTTQAGGGSCTLTKAGCGTVFSWSANVTLAPTFTPASQEFAKTKVNTTSLPKNVTIRNVNIGVATLDFSGFAVNAPFAISANTCGPTLAAGKSCKVSITFTPTVTGVSTGTLSVSDNAPGSPQTVSLSGTGD